MKLDLSLCIPTYNRAALLEKNLQHLLTFASDGFELIIGDNASTDDTPQVAAAYANKFQNFRYIRHKENLGFARNMDSILRLARKKYIYIASDDDLVFEGALELIIRIMDANQSIVGTVGSYMSQSMTEIGLQVDYSDAMMSIIEKDDHELLAGNLNVCDGHPVMRREVFQRFCNYTHRVNLIPLYFQLLALGSVARIDKPLFQHFRNSDSLTSSMGEPWFIDLANADIEVALSEHLSTTALLDPIRNRLMKTIYHQAARMAINKQDYLLFWHFAKRFKSLGEEGRAGFLEKCEVNHLINVAAQRIALMASDTGVTRLLYSPFPSVSILGGMVAKLLGESVQVAPYEEGVELTEQDMLLFESVGCFAGPDVCQKVALFDVITAFRLTAHDIVLGVGDDSLSIMYSDPAVRAVAEGPSAIYERVCLPYAG